MFAIDARQLNPPVPQHSRYFENALASFSTWH
jgi:hypothetical protein